MRQTAPKVVTLLENLVEQFGKIAYATQFNQFLSALAIAVQLLQVLQGDSALQSVLKEFGLRIADNMEAQTSLRSPRFAKQVYRFIHQPIEETRGDSADNVFFVYHPDTDWHPEFFHRVEEKSLPTNFFGMSSNLDSLCVWMLFIRSLLAQAKVKHKTRFHILIPTYRPLIITDPIIFPPELHPLTIEAHIHNSVFRVWLNIPDVPEGAPELLDVGNLAAPPTFWQRWAEPLVGLTFLGTGFGSGSAAIGVTAAVGATFAAPVVLPTFLATTTLAMWGTLTATGAVRESLKIPVPRLLGGNFDRHELEVLLGTRRVRRRHRRRSG